MTSLADEETSHLLSKHPLISDSQVTCGSHVICIFKVLQCIVFPQILAQKSKIFSRWMSPCCHNTPATIHPLFLCMLGNFSGFCCRLLTFLSKLTLCQTVWVENVRTFVGPDLGSNRIKGRSSANEKKSLSLNMLKSVRG